MGCLNRVQLLGNVGQEPRVQHLQSGNKCATFSMATSEPAYTLQNGTQVPERTEWHNVVAWGRLAEIVEQYLPKGSQVYVEGKMRTRKYTGSDNIERYTTEVVAEQIILLRGTTPQQHGANSGSVSPQNVQSGTTYQPTAQSMTQGTTEGKNEEEMPF